MTIIAVTMPRVVGGSTVVETVFAYPGMGRLLYTSIMGNDYVVAMTVVMIIAVTVVFLQFIGGRDLWLARSAHPLSELK